jgi:hypothetical protein
MASYVRRFPGARGPGGGIPSPANASLNAAATWRSVGWAPRLGGTLNTVRFFLNSITGSLGAADVSCDVYSDNAGKPGSSLASATLSGTLTAAAWNTFTGLSVALTAGTMYWLVFKNLNGTPATNFPSVRVVQNVPAGGYSPAQTTEGWLSQASTNSGGTWGSTLVGIAGFVLGYADGSFEGFACSTAAVGTDNVFGANEAGSQFTTPAGAALNVSGVSMALQPSGAPTGDVVFRLYGGAALLGTTAPVKNADIQGGANWYNRHFPAPVLVQPGTTLRVTMADTAADSAANRFLAGVEYTIDGNADSLALNPFAGTAQKVTYNGTTFTTTATRLVAFDLLLDGTAPFGAQSGGGIPNAGVMTGGMY